MTSELLPQKIVTCDHLCSNISSHILKTIAQRLIFAQKVQTFDIRNSRKWTTKLENFTFFFLAFSLKNQLISPHLFSVRNFYDQCFSSINSNLLLIQHFRSTGFLILGKTYKIKVVRQQINKAFNGYPIKNNKPSGSRARARRALTKRVTIKKQFNCRKCIHSVSEW